MSILGKPEYKSGTADAPPMSAGREIEPIRERKTVTLPLDGFVKLEQIRGDRNPVTTELKNSILEKGLLHDPLVARVDDRVLGEYIAFVNKTWKSKVSIEDFARQRQPDGWYYLIVAGHTRHQALVELVAEGKLPSSQKMRGSIVDVEGVWDIISYQVAENIHSTPKKERAATAIVEAYLYGISTGMWESQAEFLKIRKEAGDQISSFMLKNALNFSNLPADIRDQILGGVLPYSVGVEMGRLMKYSRDYYNAEAKHSGDSGVELENRQKIEELVDYDLKILFTRLLRIRAKVGKSNTMMLKEIIKTTIADRRGRTAELNLGVVASQVAEMPFQLEDITDIFLKAKKEELIQELTRLASVLSVHEDARNFMNLLVTTSEDPKFAATIDKLKRGLESSVNVTHRALGDHGVAAAALG